MSYSVLLQKHSPEGYRATLMAWPGLEVNARTQEDALDKMRAAIVRLLAEGEVVRLEIPEVEAIIAAPYEDTFGMFRDDPTFTEFLAEVEEYRRQGNDNGQA